MAWRRNLAFLWLAIVRGMVVAHIPFAVANSRILTTVTFLIFAYAFHLLRVQIVSWYKHINGKGDEDDAS